MRAISVEPLKFTVNHKNSYLKFTVNHKNSGYLKKLPVLLANRIFANYTIILRFAAYFNAVVIRVKCFKFIVSIARQTRASQYLEPIGL